MAQFLSEIKALFQDAHKNEKFYKPGNVNVIKEPISPLPIDIIFIIYGTKNATAVVATRRENDSQKCFDVDV